MDLRTVLITAVILTICEAKAISNRRSVEDSNEGSLANNPINPENTISRETINHVRHQHQQQIGNVRVVTEIDIKNLITLLTENTTNGSQPVSDTKQFGYEMLTAGEHQRKIRFTCCVY